MSACSAVEPDRRSGSEQPPPLKLLIVDDSPVARAVLSRMLSAHSDLEVVAVAGTAREAIDRLGKVRVDIVLLDVEMPGTSGLEALPDILRLGGGARVLIVSSLGADGAEASVKALSLGAADTLPKPGTGHFEGRFSDVLADRLRRIGPAVIPAPVPPRHRPFPADGQLTRPVGCVAVGASTGGLHAIAELLKGLPTSLGAPILVTQHLPAVFIPFLARQIQTGSGRTTHVAVDGLELRPDEVVLAPGDAHLSLHREGSRVTVRLDRAPAPNGCMPSVDVMLASVAAAYGSSAVAVVLSGMGRDGLRGSGRIVESGGAVLVQDQRSSAVWGMPRAVTEAGLASAVLAPSELAKRIGNRAKGGAWT